MTIEGANNIINHKNYINLTLNELSINNVLIKRSLKKKRIKY